MKKVILDQKIPSVLGLGIIVIGIVTTTFLVRGGNLLESKAGPSDTPKSIKINNLSDSSFTVTYVTSNEAVGTLTMGKDPNNLNQVILDDRDQLSQKINKYRAHSITANSLDPETTYYFTISSGSQTVTNNQKPYSVKTGSVVNQSPSSQVPLSGRVINPDGTIPSDGLVLIKINGGQNLSTYLKPNGSYLLPLNTLRNKDLTNYFPINNAVISINVISGDLSSNVDVSSNEISPVPIITLSNNYDFSEVEEKPKANSSSSASFKNLVFPKSTHIKKTNK